MKISFLTVGQGDSIIIEYFNEGPKVGIIDCCRYHGSVPTIDFLQDKGYVEVEFFILSHPHFDHYSGLNELLDLCIDDIIKIKKFYHTCQYEINLIMAAVKSLTAQSDLISIFQKISTLSNKKGLQVGYVSDVDDLQLHFDSDFRLQFMSPSNIEYNKYLGTGLSKSLFQEENPENNPNANLLSTICKISDGDRFILLTSDAMINSLVRVDRSKRIDEHLVLSQCPHHGSIKNHNNKFWEKRTRNSNCPVVISVGPNGYDHPSERVVEFLQSKGYVIYQTNSSVENVYLDLFSEVLPDEVSSIDFEF